MLPASIAPGFFLASEAIISSLAPSKAGVGSAWNDSTREIGAAHHDGGLTEAQRLFAQRRQAITGAIFERAVARNEIAAGRDPKHLAELFTSGFFFRFLMTRAAIDNAFIDAQIEAVIALASPRDN